jgi:hypothetical protein
VAGAEEAPTEDSPDTGAACRVNSSAERPSPFRLPMEAVDSKGIRWIRYDERTRILDVAYTNSGEYRYFDVGPEVYAWLVRAESKGKFVNRLVKERYRYARLDDEQVSSGESDLEQLLRDSLQSAQSKQN